MRKPPKRPKKSKATVQQRTQITHGSRGPVVYEDERVGNVTVGDVSPGDARVAVGHDMKLWASENSGGLTAGCLVNVSLVCEQTDDALSVANDAASNLALQFLQRNLEEAKQMIREFRDEDRRR
mgnify:CR=1 FL=1